MKRFLTAFVAAAAFCGAPALAADIPVKAPPPPVVGPNWSGIYFDGDIGWEQSHYNWTYPTPNIGAIISSANTIPPMSMSQSGGVMGGHIGYQQQFGWLVIGGEWGMSALMNNKWASRTALGTPAFTGGGTCITAAVNAGTQCQTLIGDVMTVGGKLGVDWGNWLVYGVGGSARGGVQSQVTFSGIPGGFSDTTNGPRYSGWYAGGGFDYMFATTRLLDFIAGVEYEHVDLGTQLQLTSFSALGTVPFSVPNFFNRNISATQDIVWAKLTVKFNPWRTQ